MWIPITVYREELVYTHMSSKTQKLLGILFQENLPSIHVIREELLNIHEIRLAYYDKTMGLTALELVDDTILHVMNSLISIVEILAPKLVK